MKLKPLGIVPLKPIPAGTHQHVETQLLSIRLEPTLSSAMLANFQQLDSHLPGCLVVKI